ncbi:MAG TPA: alpha/beta family hydrolase [Capillimicrobium sp.]|nr:alpha/beta family hydrolase [Capillimicrobium sp.]
MFRDRRDAGRRLAERLHPLRGQRAVVLALPRGGVPIAVEVARTIGAPLDVLAVRKLGAPMQPELAIGAIAEERSGLVDRASVRALGIAQDELDRIVDRESAELERRVAVYREGRPPIDLAGRTAVIVDDGMATGLTVLAAVRAARARGAARVVVAAPVASPSAISLVAQEADDVVVVTAPEDLRSVGSWYDDFEAVPDEDVLAQLRAARGTPPGEAAAERGVALTVDGGTLHGDLTVPASAAGLVLFAHGSGSSRLSPRNRAVARALNGRGLATLLFDLLTERESSSRAAVFDIALLASRLEAATRWATAAPAAAGLAVGYFGASTGAAAALCAAAELDGAVKAIVSRGGRPDLAGDRLPDVTAPTLLIVGSRDTEVLELNRQAARALRCEHELAIVPGATHLFEEPGALEAVADLAGRWLVDHLAATPAASAPVTDAPDRGT